MAQAARKPFVHESRASSRTMAEMPSPAWFALAAAIAATSVPAAAQVQVVVDGRTQQVPAGVVRTISYEPGGPQTVRDEPFNGQTAPGYATITTTETTDSNEDGSDPHTHVVTRIEPMPVTAVAYAPPIPAPTTVQATDWAQPVNYYIPAGGGQPQQVTPEQARQILAGQQDPQQAGYSTGNGQAPRLDVDPATYDQGYDDGQAKVLRVHRDGMTGHFITAITINGVRVKAIIDTGAQETMLSARDARACGADREVIRSTPMSGIGGTTMLNIARVHSLEIGGQSLGGFTAAIQADGIPYTLLGQTEIAKLGRIVIEDGVMTITPRALTRLASR